MPPLYPAQKSTVPYVPKIAAFVPSHVAPQSPGQPVFLPAGAGMPPRSTKRDTRRDVRQRRRTPAEQDCGEFFSLSAPAKLRLHRSVFASLHVSAHGSGLGLLRSAEHGCLCSA